MNINNDFNQVFLKIITSLNENRSFLALRYGDGEAILLKNNEKNIVEHIFSRQLNEILKKESIEEIRKNLIETINNADLLGIPTEYHLSLGSCWTESLNILKIYCNIKTTDFGSIDFHYEFLRNWESRESCYDKLLLNRQDLYIISCRDLARQFSKRFNITNVQFIPVPPEMMFEEKRYRSKHYPDRFLEIQQIIKNLGDLKGKLLLYGSGFVGKIYGLFWKNQGGVAVDIGSVFDVFAGKDTRGPNCSPTTIKTTYKV
ncbi:MAG: hypothetical protein PHF86_04200 [Candidatus Nanoarchaeia archaeon]|jgi:hypothetical protein|nr:hypothetical protein [Candidatus Nanoarchaeia archaeon]